MSAFVIRAATAWAPPYQATMRGARELAVGMVVGWEYAAWEVAHASERTEPTPEGRDMRATLHRLHGPRHPNENDHRDMAVSYARRWGSFHVYDSGRVWLCSCCGDPVPCRSQVAEEASVAAAATFEERLSRMGPGLCYGCGEVITKRQERVTFPGEHADFPGRGGPTFHTRQTCADERHTYARRARRHPDGGPLPKPCEGHLTHNPDGSTECTIGACEGARTRHRSEGWS